MIISTSSSAATSVYAADLDGDGDADVLSASSNDNKIAWYRNNGSGGFSSQIILSTAALGARSVFAADLDGDGDQDALSTSLSDDKVAWYRNNGTGGFSPQIIITTAADSPRAVFAADLNGDGAMDVLSASDGDNRIAWCRNNGTGGFSPLITITTNATGALAVFAADLDADGDVDVLSASRDDDKVAWYRNNGTGGFSLQIVLSLAADGASAVYAADLDADGDRDVVSGAAAGNEVAWYRNSGAAVFSQAIVLSGTAQGVDSLFVGDVDGDGDHGDVVMALVNNDRVSWLQNNGSGVFSALTPITALVLAPRSVYAIDIDGDGDLDLLSASEGDNKIAWYRNSRCGNISVPFATPQKSASPAGSNFTIACNTNYELVGNATFVCALSTWTGGLCAPIANCPVNPSNTLAGPFVPSTIGVGLPSNITFTTRNTLSASVRCGDVITLVTTPSFTWRLLDFGSPTYIIELSGTKAGSYTLVLRINGALAALPTVNVVPGLPSAAATTLDCVPSSCGTVVSFTPTAFTVGIRDSFGNLVSSGNEGNVNASLYLLASGTPAETTLTITAPGTLVLSLYLSPGLYKLLLLVNGQAALGGTLDLFATEFCVPGLYLQVNGVCTSCPPDTFSDKAQLARCTQCPNGTTTFSSIGASSPANCTCVVGRYTLAGPGSACKDCPVGAVCDGGTLPPLSLPGWAPNSAADAFARCPRPASCLGGSRGCNAGYAGYLCKDCRPTYYADANGECRRCPPASSVWLFFYVLIVVGLSLVASLLLFLTLVKPSSKISSGAAMTSAVVRSRRFPQSVPLVITAFQIVGVLSIANLSWPASAQRALNAFSVFSLDVNLFASECSLSSFTAKYLVSLGTPAVFALLVLIELALIRCGGRILPALADLDSVPLGVQLLSGLLLVGPLAYLPLARSTLVLFDCTRLADGRLYLDADMSVLCFGKSWWTLFPFGLLGVLAYVVSVPAAIALTLYRHREALFLDPGVVRAYGSVYKLFRRQFVFLPVALLFKKLAIAICSLFLSRLQPFLLVGLLGIIFGGGMAQARAQPYYFPIYDRIELAFTVLLSTVLACGLVLYSSTTDDSTHGRTVLVVVIVIAALVAMVALAVWFVARDLLDILRERRERAGSLTDGGGGGVGGESAHARRVRAWAEHSLQDIDDPAAFLATLSVARARSDGISDVPLETLAIVP